MSGTAELAAALNELKKALDAQGLKYCLIGGLAAIHWGEPRFTHDIDIVVSAVFGNEEPIVNALLREFPTRLKLAEAKAFALQNRVLLLESHSGIPVDISLGGLVFEDQMLSPAGPAT